MRSRPFLVLAALVFALVPPGPGHCDEPPTITAAMRSEDPRLESTVSLSYHRVYLGDMLDVLTASTGVSIDAGKRDGSGDIQICVNCSNVRLGDLLDSIWSLMSYRGALWKWERSGKAGGYHYTLRQPYSAARFKQSMRDWEQDRFETMMRKLLAAVDESDDAKKAVLQELYYFPQLGPIRDSPTIPMDVFWSQLRLIKESFGADRLLPFLRGEGPRGGAIIQTESLSAQSKAFLDRERQFMIQISGGQDPPPVNPTIRIELKQAAKPPQINVIYQGGRTAPLYIGGAVLAVGLKQRMLTLWQHAGDALDHESAHLRIRPTAATVLLPDRLAPEGPARSYWQRMASTLFEISRGASVNLLARLPDNEPDWSINPPREMTIEQYWTSMYGRRLFQKWRNGMHLVSSSDWPLLDGPVPLDFVRKLRKDGPPGSYLPVEDLSAAANNLTDVQLLDLQWDFPPLAEVVAKRDMISLFERFPELARRAQAAEGLALTPQTIAILQQLPPLQFTARLRPDAGETLRIRVTKSSVQHPTSRDLVFEFFGRKGNLTGFQTFQQVAQPKPEPVAR